MNKLLTLSLMALMLTGSLAAKDKAKKSGCENSGGQQAATTSQPQKEQKTQKVRQDKPKSHQADDDGAWLRAIMG